MKYSTVSAIHASAFANILLALNVENRIFATIRKSQGSGKLQFKCKGAKLTNVEGFFGTSDPFFEIARKVDAGGGQTWYVILQDCKAFMVKSSFVPILT